MERVRIPCQYAVSGNLKTDVLYSEEPFSFWGGVERETGIITDRRHDRYDESMSGAAFVFPFGKGSSGAGTTIMEMVRLKTAPSAIINLESDPVLLTGPLIAKYFYDVIIPVVNVTKEDYNKLKSAKQIEFYEQADYIDAYYEE
ncbi:MAG: DUF126 domain-containing protein [Eubacteriaceae bacterium]|jgi:predicted aconitase with swiveling domain|nr:DUF126 domain-containing protein [Eubacteriaceae bacterium]